MSTTKITAAIVAGILCVLLIWWIALKKNPPARDPRSEESLRKLAADINRSVPIMIDKETELLPAASGPAMLIYNYRLVSYSVARLDAEKFATGAKQRVAQGTCNQPQTRDDLLKNGVTLRYSYFDKNKQHIATIDVTPADCGF